MRDAQLNSRHKTPIWVKATILTNNLLENKKLFDAFQIKSSMFETVFTTKSIVSNQELFFIRHRNFTFTNPLHIRFYKMMYHTATSVYMAAIKSCLRFRFSTCRQVSSSRAFGDKTILLLGSASFALMQ